MGAWSEEYTELAIFPEKTSFTTKTFALSHFHTLSPNHNLKSSMYQPTSPHLTTSQPTTPNPTATSTARQTTIPPTPSTAKMAPETPLSKTLEKSLLASIADLETQAEFLDREMRDSQAREQAHVEYEQALRKSLAARQDSMRARAESNKRVVAALAEAEAAHRGIDEAEVQSRKEVGKEVRAAEKKIAAATFQEDVKQLCDNLYAKED